LLAPPHGARRVAHEGRRYSFRAARNRRGNEGYSDRIACDPAAITDRSGMAVAHLGQLAGRDVSFLRMRDEISHRECCRMDDRAGGQSATAACESVTACWVLRTERCRSSLFGLLVVLSYRGHMGGHALGREVGVLVPDRVVDAGVLVQFPFAEAFKI